MVEYTINLDTVFSSLGDKTRRAILARVLERPRTISELAKDHIKMSFAAVSKHIGVLEDAQLVIKQRKGRNQVVTANPEAVAAASEALEQFKAIWESRFTKLEELLNE